MNIFGRTAIIGTVLAAAALTAAGPAVAAAQPTTAPEPTATSATALDESIVWVDVEWNGLVEVPYDDGTVATYQASTASYCTGWFVSERGHVATAGHCLEQSPDIAAALIETVVQEQGLDVGYLTLDDLLATWRYQIDDPIAHVGQPSVVHGPISGQSIIAQVVDVQPFDNGDNALLRIANIDGTPALAIADEQPEVNEDVVAVGFAGSVDLVTDTDRQPPSHKRGYVSSLSTSSRGAPITEIDAAITQGMSGGPTVNASGEVIGINSFLVRGESQPFNFITDTESLRTFLTEQGVQTAAATNPDTDAPATTEPAPTKPATEPVGASTDPTPAAQDRPAQESATQAPVQQTDASAASSSTSSSSNNTVLLIAVIALGAVLLIGGVVTAVLLRRRSRTSSTPPAGGAPAGAPMGMPLPHGPATGPQFGSQSGPARPSHIPNGAPVPVPGPGFPEKGPTQGNWSTWNR